MLSALMPDLLRDLVREVQEDDLSGIAAELSYRWLLALFPLLLMVGALSGTVADWLGAEDPTEQILDSLRATLPADATATIGRQLDRVLSNSDGGLISLGFVGALWAASGGMKAVMKGLNRAYDIDETRPWWRKTLVGLGLTALLGVATISAFLLLVVGQFVASDLAGRIGLEDTASTVFQWARFPLAVLALMIAAAFLYWAAPASHLRFRWITPGALLFVPAWLIATFVFSLYVANFGSDDDTYGALGGVIVLMLWFYFTSFLLMIGGELNAVLEKRVAEEAPASERQRDQEPDPETTEARESGENSEVGRDIPGAAPVTPAHATSTVIDTPTQRRRGAGALEATAGLLLTAALLWRRRDELVRDQPN